MKHIKQYLNFIKEEYEWEPGKPQFTPKKKKYPNEHKLDLTDTSLDPRDTEGNFGKRWEEKVKITPSGNKHFYMSGLKYNTKNVHRIEYANGSEWYKNGELHRDGDKPAVEYSNGDKMWYQNGKLHRDGDKPAVEYAIGDKKWYKNGEFHRDDDKPAIEYVNGTKKWYQNGLLHRDGDKPAIEHASGTKEYWKNGIRYK